MASPSAATRFDARLDHPRSSAISGWVDNGAVGAWDGAWREQRPINAIAENVEHGLSGANEIIGDDSTMTAPPDRFGAHND